jgi:hypothetical protein
VQAEAHSSAAVVRDCEPLEEDRRRHEHLAGRAAGKFGNSVYTECSESLPFVTEALQVEDASAFAELSAGHPTEADAALAVRVCEDAAPLRPPSLSPERARGTLVRPRLRRAAEAKE